MIYDLVFLFSIYLFVYYSLFCFLRCICGYNTLGGACLLLFYFVSALGFHSPGLEYMVFFFFPTMGI